MKTKSECARNIFYECLKTLGFSVTTLNDFFYFLRDCTKEVEDLVRKIDGGVVEGGWNIICRAGNDAYYRRDNRYKITDKAGFVAAMTVCNRNEEIDSDLELHWRPKADFNILADKKLAETRRLLFESFRDGFFHQDEINTCVNHWRGLLDTRRVNLRLAGKDDYPKDVKQADIFLRILDREGFTKPKARVKKAA